MNLTQNFSRITVPLYIHTQSASMFVRTISAFELRRAAQAELAKYPPAIDETSGQYIDAERAFFALENLIKRKRKLAKKGESKEWHPTLLEANLFSYLFLLLELPEEKWADDRLVKCLKEGFPGLVAEVGRWKEDIGELKRPEVYDWICEAV
jgi:metaxin